MCIDDIVQTYIGEFVVIDLNGDKSILYNSLSDSNYILSNILDRKIVKINILSETCLIILV